MRLIRSILLWLPTAVLTFLFAALTTTFLIQPTGLSNCVVKLPVVEKRAANDDPSSKEIAQIYALVLGEEGFVGFLRNVKGYEWTFEAFDYSYRPTYLTQSKKDLKQLRSFGLDKETIEKIKRPSSSKPLRRYLTSIQGLVLRGDGSQFVFDEGSDTWVPVQSEVRARGGISVSEVVYNRDRSLAVVSVGLICGSYCGESGFYVLRKSHETWRITGSYGFRK